MTSSQALREDLNGLIARAVTADQQLLDSVLPSLVALVQEAEAAALREFFKADPKGVELFLTKGIPPTTFAGKRFAAMLPILIEMVNAIYKHERELVDNYLDNKVKPEERDRLVRGSLFMSPAIKAAILAEWVNKPWKGQSLSARVWDFSKASEDTLLKLVASNIAEGKSPRQIAPIVKRTMGTQSSSIVNRLLLTESSRLWHDVQATAIQEFKHIKYVVLKYGNRHKKDCACTPYKDKGKMLYSDAPTMPIHPSSSSFLQPIID